MKAEDWLSSLGTCFVVTLYLLPVDFAKGADCNHNGVEDACDVDCMNPGCTGVPGCGGSEDCNANDVPDECDVSVLYAGTQGGKDGGGAKVLRYAGGTNWEDLTPPGWDDDVSAVMDLAFFNGYLYAGVQTKPGYGGGFYDRGDGQVWRYDGVGWTLVSPVGGLDASVMVLEVLNGSLYAGTSAGAEGGSGIGRLYRCTLCDGSDWQGPLDGEWPNGFRSGIVSSLCGSARLYLGDLDDDKFFCFDPHDPVNPSDDDLYMMENHGGSCIWDFAEFGDKLYAGAWAGSGPVYWTSQDWCDPASEDRWITDLEHAVTGRQNWAIESFRGRLYIGTGDIISGEDGAQLLVSDGATWPATVLRSWDTTLPDGGVSALAAQEDLALFIGTGLPDGWFDTESGWPTNELAEVWRFDGASFKRVSPPDDYNIPQTPDLFGGGVQTLFVKPGTSSDCNANGIPDECDVAGATSQDCNQDGIPDECQMDCNTNGIPDDCDADCNNNGVPDDCDACVLFPGDRDRDCDTDLLDFAGFQDCFNSNGAVVSGPCQCAFDLDTNGAPNVLTLADYVAFEALLAGPSGGGQMMMGGEGSEGMMAMSGLGVEGESLDAGLLDNGSAAVDLEVPPEPDPWTYASADLSFELRPVGGGEAVTTLAPHTTYEVYYAAATEQVGFYLLIAVAGSSAQGLTGAAPPAVGDWSGAGHFLFRNAAAEAGAPVPAPEYGQGWYRTHSVSDDFFPAADTAGSAGVLCTITTGEPGELALELYMDWADPETFRLVMLQAQATLTVAPPT
jgi:hypothetical protein